MGDNTQTKQLDWKCHTPRLFEEILTNPGTSILQVPLKILLSILGEVAQRAIELDDRELNRLMIRLTLFSCADPASEDYDEELVRKYMERDTKPSPAPVT